MGILLNGEDILLLERRDQCTKLLPVVPCDVVDTLEVASEDIGVRILLEEGNIPIGQLEAPIVRLIEEGLDQHLLKVSDRDLYRHAIKVELTA